jgi:hypothetical protein
LTNFFILAYATESMRSVVKKFFSFFLFTTLFFVFPTIVLAADYCAAGDPKCPVINSHSISCNGTTSVKSITYSWKAVSPNGPYNLVYSHSGKPGCYYQSQNIKSTSVTIYGTGKNGNCGTDVGIKAGESVTAKVAVWNGVSGTYFSNYGQPPDRISAICTASAPTPTSHPTTNPTPTTPITPGPTIPPATTGNLSVQIDGIGLQDNPNPLHPTRKIVLYFYNPTDTSFQHILRVFTGIVTFNPNTGYFSNASFPLTGLFSGHYLVLVRTPQGSLVAQIGTGDGTGPIYITTTGGANMLVDLQDAQDTNADTTPPILLMGDLVNDCQSSSSCNFNYIFTLDWSALVDCFGDKKTSVACVAHGTFPNTQDTLADLNDDGVVDGVDYTMVLRNFAHFGIGQQNMDRGNPPQ